MVETWMNRQSFDTWLAGFTSYAGVHWTHALKARWPRLTAVVAATGCLSWTEATGALRCLKEPDTMPVPEAVAHYGGARKLVQDAIRERHRWRDRWTD